MNIVPLTLQDVQAEKRRVGASAVRLRIESAGSMPETRVLAIEEDGTEHEILLVQSVRIDIAHGEANVATVQFVNVEVDAIALPVAAEGS